MLLAVAIVPSDSGVLNPFLLLFWIHIEAQLRRKDIVGSAVNSVDCVTLTDCITSN